MWNRNAAESDAASDPPAAAPARPQPITPSRPQAPASEATAPDSRAATIGPSISIKGDISGEEDLLIEGNVQGEIELREHNVTVGSSGRVAANIHGKRICVDGQVTGDLFGDEILIRKSGQVNGNASAPRVTLENGCHFRGNIDMKPAQGPAKTASRAAVS